MKYEVQFHIGFNGFTSNSTLSPDFSDMGKILNDLQCIIKGLEIGFNSVEIGSERRALNIQKKMIETSIPVIRTRIHQVIPKSSFDIAFNNQDVSMKDLETQVFHGVFLITLRNPEE